MSDQANNIKTSNTKDGVATDMLPEYHKCLNARTLLVVFYGAFILMPANIYMQLVSGQNLAGPISFITLILWVEGAKLARRPLNSAEAFIVYAISGVAASQMMFYIYGILPAYFKTSDIANAFTTTIGGETKTFSDIAPKWWVPSKEVVALRTFFHVDWMLPLGMVFLVWLMHFAADISMAVVGRELFIKQEKLPFPWAQPCADACNTLTEDRPEKRKVFTIAGLIGTIWGLVVYFPHHDGIRYCELPYSLV